MGQKPTGFDKFSQSAGKWLIIINILVVLVGFVSQYSVNQYKQKVMQTEIDKLEVKVDKLENKLDDFNPELIVKQLQAIQQANNELNQKIEKQSGRIDNVLEILVKK